MSTSSLLIKLKYKSFLESNAPPMVYFKLKRSFSQTSSLRREMGNCHGLIVMNSNYIQHLVIMPCKVNMNVFIPPCLLIKMRDRKIFRMLFQLVMQSNQSFSQIIWRTKGRKLRNGQDLTAKRYFL